MGILTMLATSARLSGQALYRLLSSIAVPPKAASNTILTRANIREISLIQKIKFFISFSFIVQMCNQDRPVALLVYLLPAV